MVAMENLFNHLTRKEVNKEIHHREFDTSRSQRLHWIRYHTEQRKADNMLYFSVAEPRSTRTYIYDIDERYVIVLEPQRKCIKLFNPEMRLYFAGKEKICTFAVEFIPHSREGNRKTQALMLCVFCFTPILPLMANQYFQHQRRMAWLPWKIY